jgi:hypothetical protein
MKIDPIKPGTRSEIAVNARVELVTDKYAGEGATRGMIGYVLEKYPDGNYEVEFSNSQTGETIAQIVVERSELIDQPAPEKAIAARYYAVNDRPVAIVPTANGGQDCLVYDFASGELLPDRSYFEQVSPGSGKDVDSYSENEFAARVAALRAESAKQAVARLRAWLEALGGATGDVSATAAAMGFSGRLERGDFVVEPTPGGYTKFVIRDLRGDVGLELRPLGSLLVPAICDAEFGQGRKLPIVDVQTAASIAYPPIKAAKSVELSMEFSRSGSANDGGAHRIFARRSSR